MIQENNRFFMACLWRVNQFLGLFVAAPPPTTDWQRVSLLNLHHCHFLCRALCHLLTESTFTQPTSLPPPFFLLDFTGNHGKCCFLWFLWNLQNCNLDKSLFIVTSYCTSTRISTILECKVTNSSTPTP